MSLFKAFTGSKRGKAADQESKSTGDNLHCVKNPTESPKDTHLTQGEVGGATEPSLFNGMTISSGPTVATVAKSTNLMDLECTIAMPKTATGPSTTSMTSTSTTAPSVGAEQLIDSTSGLSSSGKKKKRVQAKRPGYARSTNKLSEGTKETPLEPQTPQAATSSSTSTASTCTTAATVTVTTSIASSSIGLTSETIDEGTTSTTEGRDSCEKLSNSSTPLYSIGTPSSSDENLADLKLSNTEHDVPSVEDPQSDNPMIPLTELPKEPYLSDIEPLKPTEQEKQSPPLEHTGNGNIDVLVDKEIKDLDMEFIVSMENSTLKTSENNSSAINQMLISDLLEDDKKTLGESLSDLSSIHQLGDSLKDGVSTSGQNSEGKFCPSSNVKSEEELVDLGDSPAFHHEHLEINSSGSADGPVNYSVVLDAHDKLELLLQHRESQLSALSEDKGQLQELVAGLLLTYSDDNKLRQQKEQELRKLQLEENQALASDSYDLAEEKNSCIEELKQELKAMKYRLPAQDKKVKTVLNLQDELNKREAAYHRTTQASLEELRDEQSLFLKEYKEANTAKLSKDKMTLSSRRQQLDRAVGHLQLDREHLQKGETELNEEIELQTRKFQLKKDEQLENRTEIQEEIEEMERKLKELHCKEAEYTDAIKQEDMKMEEVKKEFEPQQKLLTQQRQEIDERQKSLSSETDELSTIQEAFDEKSAEFESKRDSLEKLVAEIHDVIQKSRETSLYLDEQCEKTTEYLHVEHFVVSVTPELASLQEERDQCAETLKNLTDRIQQAERNMNTLKKRLNEIEAHISDLDIAKEKAKQARNFKEAKRIKEESEALNSEGLESQQKLESLTEEVAANKNLLEKAQKENDRVKTELEEKEYQSALSTVDAAAETVKSLSRQTASYQGDSLLSALLAVEIASCQNLILDLCEKHNIPKPELEVVGAEEQSVEDPQEDQEVEDSKEDLVTAEDRQTELNELINQLDELEGKLEAVVEVEDFDQADDIQQDILKVKDRIAALKDSL